MCHQGVRDRRSTDERSKRNGIQIERTGPRTEPCGTPQVRGDEEELCGGIPTVDVLDEIYKEKHCSETEEMPNRVERRWMEWSRVSQAADRSSRKRQETCCMEIALAKCSCRESRIEFGIGRLKGVQQRVGG